MALVTMKELLERAKSNYRGIGAFSVGNMEMVKGASDWFPRNRSRWSNNGRYGSKWPGRWNSGSDFT